ncbi:MAG: PqqD family protein [Azospirillaceae bacterium]|nr:PqqD family protein [Azospirillaceae bacterium]
MRISRRGDWLTALVGEELVMMSAKHGNDISPTAVGARVSATIDPSLTLDDLVARLTVEFEVSDETCRVKVPSYLEELAGHGAIAFDPPPTGSRHPA